MTGRSRSAYTRPETLYTQAARSRVEFCKTARRWRHIRTLGCAEFTELASDEQIAKAAAALERNGIRSLLAATGADARSLVGSLLTDGAEIYNNTSQTLEAIGVADDIERSGRYEPLRLRLYRMDREMQRREMRTLAASPDYVVGSVHALTEDGSLLIASASGSQLGPLVSGAGNVILVIRGPEDRQRRRNRDAAHL
jgi:hypothetical protein